MPQCFWKYALNASLFVTSCLYERKSRDIITVKSLFCFCVYRDWKRERITERTEIDVDPRP